MIFRNKKLKTTAAAIAILSVVASSGVGVVSADTLLPGENVKISSNKVSNSLNNGIYSVENNTRYAEENNPTGESMARNSIDKNTKIEVKDGKVNMTIKFSDSLYMFMKDFKVSIGEKDLEIKENKENKSITFEVPSADTEVKIKMHITMMKKDVELFLTNDMSTLKVTSEAPQITAQNIELTQGDSIDLLKGVSALDKEDGDLTKDIKIISDTRSFIKDGKVIKDGSFDVTYEVVDSSSVRTTRTIKVNVAAKTVVKPEDTQTKEEKYTIQNDVVYIGSGNADLGNEMARKIVAKEGRLVKKDGKYKATLSLDKDMYGFMKNIRVSVDKKEIQNVDKNGNLEFDIPSLNSEIIVTAFVSPMGRDVSFKVVLNEDTLKKIDSTNSETEGETDTDIGSGSGTGSGSGSNNGLPDQGGNSSENGNDSGSQVQDEEKNVVKGKLYTIQNKVIHESQTGQEMARKYLNSTTKIEIVNGKTYATFTFTGSNFMKDHKIYVNGSKVSYQIVSRSGDSVSLRFEIPNIDAKIKVGLFVVPMSRQVDFEVQLLKSTLKFIKDYEVSANGSTLPQTGSPVGTQSMLGLGSMMMASGAVLSLRKKKN